MGGLGADLCSPSQDFTWLGLGECQSEKHLVFVKRFYTVLTKSLPGQLTGETVAKTTLGGTTPWPGLLSYANFFPDI